MAPPKTVPPVLWIEKEIGQTSRGRIFEGKRRPRKAVDMANAMPGRVELKWLSDEELKQAVNLQLDEVDPFRKLFEQVICQILFPHAPLASSGALKFLCARLQGPVRLFCMEKQRWGFSQDLGCPPQH
jgi:hypothetical protein